MAIVVPNVATAEECLELADAACEIVQLWKLRPKSWFESSGSKDKMRKMMQRVGMVFQSCLGEPGAYFPIW